jgi:hypothetical protein
LDLEAGDHLSVEIKVLDTADLTVDAKRGYTGFPRPPEHDAAAGRYSAKESTDEYNTLTKTATAVLLRHVGRGAGTFRVGSDRMFSQDSRPLGKVLVTHRGFYGSIKTSIEGPLLNYNMMTSVFYQTITMRDFIDNAGDIDFRQALDRIMVEIKNPDGTVESSEWHVGGFGLACHEQKMRFDSDETVAQYYKRGKYAILDDCPNKPRIRMHPEIIPLFGRQSQREMVGAGVLHHHAAPAVPGRAARGPERGTRLARVPKCQQGEA